MKKIIPLLIALSGCVPSTVTDATSAADASDAAAVASTDKAITSFLFTSPAATGIIDQELKTVSVEMPAGADLTALVAQFEATGTGVSVGGVDQVSGETVNDFSEDVFYVVSAEDGSSVSYCVSAISPRVLSAEKALTAFSIMEPSSTGVIDQEAGVIRVHAGDGADLSALVAEFTCTGASVTVNGEAQESGVTVNDFTASLDYVVTAEDGSTSVYAVRVTGRIGLLINEADVDQVGADTAEYVELYADTDIDLAGICIVQLNGGVTPGVEYARVDLSPAGAIAAGGYLVIAGPGVTVAEGSARYAPTGWGSSNRIQNGPNDALMLLDTIGGRVIDTVSYAGVLHRAVVTGLAGEWDATEGDAGAPADSNSAVGSISRLPNGTDTGQNGADFAFSASLTPGAPNQ